MAEEITGYDTVTFARIQTSTGEILDISACEEGDLSVQAATGETIVPNPPAGVTDQTHYYKNGAFKVFPAKPGDYSDFNYTTETWTDTRSSDRNADFDQAHYEVDPTVTVSGNTLTVAAFTPRRDNGVYAESKTRPAQSLTYPGKVCYPAYDYDSNSTTLYDSLSQAQGPRRFLLGEFRGAGVFIDRRALFDGDYLSWDSLGNDHFKTEAISVDKLRVGDFNNRISDPNGKNLKAWSTSSASNNMQLWTSSNTSDLINSGIALYSRVGNISDAINTAAGWSEQSIQNGFPVKPGEEYYLRAVVHCNASASAIRAYFGLIVSNGIGNSSSKAYPQLFTDWSESQSGWRVIEGFVKIPDNTPDGGTVANAMPRIFVHSTATVAGVRVIFGGMIIRRANTGDLTVDGTLRGNHIEFDTLVGDHLKVDTIEGKHMKMESITVRELSVGDYSNMLINDWTGGKFDGWATNAPVGAGSNGYSVASRTDPILNSAGVAGFVLRMAGGDYWVRSSRSSVTAGQKIYVEVYGARFTGANTPGSQSLVQVRWTYNDGSTGYTTVGAFTGAGNLVKIANTITVPANAVDASIWIRHNAGSVSDGVTMWAKPQMRNAIDGKLIVNGEVVTDHVASRAVTQQSYWTFSGTSTVTRNMTTDGGTQYILLIGMRTTSALGVTGAKCAVAASMSGNSSVEFLQRQQLSIQTGEHTLFMFRFSAPTAGTATFEINNGFDTGLGLITDILIQEFKR